MTDKVETRFVLSESDIDCLIRGERVRLCYGVEDNLVEYAVYEGRSNDGLSFLCLGGTPTTPDVLRHLAERAKVHPDDYGNVVLEWWETKKYDSNSEGYAKKLELLQQARINKIL